MVEAYIWLSDGTKDRFVYIILSEFKKKTSILSWEKFHWIVDQSLLYCYVIVVKMQKVNFIYGNSWNSMVHYRFSRSQFLQSFFDQ